MDFVAWSARMIASAAIAAYRWVGRSGTHATTSAGVAGISEQAAAPGKAFSAITGYSAPVEAAEAIPAEAFVKPAADGSGRVAVGSESDNCGWAISAAAAGALCACRFVERAGGGAVSGAGKLQQIASRTKVPIAKNTGLHQACTRSAHVMLKSVTSVTLAFSNFAVLAGVETGAGSACDITASIEYPAGVYTQVKFSGAAQGSIPDNSYLLADQAPLSIPVGATFWVRTWRNCAGGILYTGGQVPALPTDGFASSATTTPDLTMGGAITAATTNIYTPCAILGYCAGRSVGVISDSIGYGTGDTVSDQTGNLGYIEKALSASIGVMNLGDPSDSASLFVVAGNRVNRLSLLQYVTDVIVAMGTNDFSGGAAAAITNMGSIAAVLSPMGLRLHTVTVPPRSSSTDAYATVANQTAHGTLADRILFNSAVRNGGIAGFLSYFEVADAAEATRNSGKWRINDGDASPAITGDGVHPNTSGHRLIAASGAVNPARFLAA